MPDQSNASLFVQFRASCAPLLAMYNDVQLSFMPYNVQSEFYRDLYQFPRGIRTIVRSLLIWPLILFLFIERFISMFVHFQSVRGVFSELAHLFAMMLIWTCDSVFSLTRGVTQVAFSPLTYLCRLLLRFYLTVRNDGVDLFANPKIVDLYERIKYIRRVGKPVGSYSQNWLIQQLDKEVKKYAAEEQLSVICNSGRGDALWNVLTEHEGLCFDKFEQAVKLYRGAP